MQLQVGPVLFLGSTALPMFIYNGPSSGVILKCLSSHICDDGMIVLLLFPRGFKCKLRVSFFFFANDKKRMLDAQGRMDPFF
jgi:hypothetical protein